MLPCQEPRGPEAECGVPGRAIENFRYAGHGGSTGSTSAPARLLRRNGCDDNHGDRRR